MDLDDRFRRPVRAANGGPAPGVYTLYDGAYRGRRLCEREGRAHHDDANAYDAWEVLKRLH